MDEHLRFTGAWPPPKLWREYPNWEYALDEEGIEGQDETTLRPATIQDHIAEYVAFTAADVTLANGQHLPALLEVFTGDPDAINVMLTDEDGWRIFYSTQEQRWVPFIQDWLPENERSPSVTLDDLSVFPLTVSSRLPRKPGEALYQFKVLPSGDSQRLA